MQFQGVAFIQRFVQHILPPYFQRVRYFGIYAWTAKLKKQKAYQLITKQKMGGYTKPLKRQLLKKMLGIDPDVCPNCKAYQTLCSNAFPTDPDSFFFLKAKWHNVHIKLWQHNPNIAV